jgi:hypothetical protein
MKTKNKKQQNYFLMHFSKYFLLTCLLLCLNINSVISQNKELVNNRTFATISTGHFQYKDNLMNGLRNQGLGILLALDHNRKKNSFVQNYRARLNYASLVNRYDMSSFLAGVNLNYKLMKKTQNFLYGMDLDYSTMLYENEYFDAHHNYWSSRISAGFISVLKRDLSEKASVTFKLSIPLFGWISRPETEREFVLNEPDLNKTDIIERMNSGYQFALEGEDFIYIDTGIGFFYKLNNGRRISIAYNLYYEQTKISSKTQLISNMISIGYQL